VLWLTGVTSPRILLLVLALLQAGGIFDVMRRAACEAECERDDCKDCAPDDTGSCPCHCPSAPIATAPSVAVSAVAPVQPTALNFDRADRAPPTPDPREILHVPRRAAVRASSRA